MAIAATECQEARRACQVVSRAHRVVTVLGMRPAREIITTMLTDLDLKNFRSNIIPEESMNGVPIPCTQIFIHEAVYCSCGGNGRDWSEKVWRNRGDPMIGQYVNLLAIPNTPPHPLL